MTGVPHDVPTVDEMLEAVGEWLASATASASGSATDSGASLTGFHARVAANMLAMVRRELALGPEHERRHLERLSRLGVADDRELAAAIRQGRLDDRAGEVRELVWQSVRDKLQVANPGYLDR